MTHALPIPSRRQPVRLLPMQFAAPLRTAESWGIDPFEEAAMHCRAARSERELTRAPGRSDPLAWRLAAAGVILAGGGLALWGLA
ncbi:hypothetical protein [Rhodobacter capsulatus]|jgi:hypothetical protein|uniref:Uncharacterized protein n=1 Tax=Rhodobacter capsulatus (strain ATCC BAA-309 / NBRC 16581 / SB1003) TaxID=272942 RepID=D5AKW8_RHOCB|nr:hypothetical protein [Rhodobacter capsulatus]ADE85958.1 conserved hypothetical protein [Rhodobacter capsulatus SB 1003]ETD01307.1 hypothetical protein U714_12460 [Rhodobacter capsulatus DE442]ETD75885.1 hypothetical protein U717_12625 [Rhodobacter capsulatus R121]ETE53362.1 hypothetical protein U715_12625 [Rhodobacter capsulatus Y262]MDS0927796.1 hypothetical protein [Rhodobacter capsulatus]